MTEESGSWGPGRGSHPLSRTSFRDPNSTRRYEVRKLRTQFTVIDLPIVWTLRNADPKHRQTYRATAMQTHWRRHLRPSYPPTGGRTRDRNAAFATGIICKCFASSRNSVDCWLCTSNPYGRRVRRDQFSDGRSRHSVIVARPNQLRASQNSTTDATSRQLLLLDCYRYMGRRGHNDSRQNRQLHRSARS